MSATYLPPEQQPEAGPAPPEEPQATTDQPEAPLSSQDGGPDAAQHATPAPAPQPAVPPQAQWDQARAGQQWPSMSQSWQPTAYGPPPYGPQQTYGPQQAYPPPYPPPQPPKSRKGLRAAVFTVIGLAVVIGVTVAAVTLSGGGSATPSTAAQWHTWLDSGGRAALSRYTSDYSSWDNATYCASTKVVAQSLVDDAQAVLAVTSPLPESVSSPLQSWANHSRGAFQADIAYCSTPSGSSAESETESTFRSERSAMDASLTELRSTLSAAGVPEADLEPLPSSSGSDGGTA